MKRTFTLFAALMLTAFTAGATVPETDTDTTTTETVAAIAEPETLVVEEVSEDDGFWMGASFDFASNYIWRGFDQSYRGGDKNMFDPSLQAGLTFGYGNFYIDLWANHSRVSQYNELDIFLGYENENLTITLYDVLSGVGEEFTKMDVFDTNNHSLTATIDYTMFDRLRLHWSTTFIHSGDKLATGEQAYSSYFEVAYTQPVRDLFNIELTAGASPWTSPFWCYERDMESVPTGFNVTNLSLMLTKDFELGFITFPIKAGYIYNPTTNFNYLYLQTGIAF